MDGVAETASVFSHQTRARIVDELIDLIDAAHGLKVDLFVLGEGLLDRMQIERRMNVLNPRSRGSNLGYLAGISGALCPVGFSGVSSPL